MRLDPALEARLRAENALTAPDLASLPLGQALAFLRQAKPPASPPEDETAVTEDRLISGANGNQIPVRIYRPPGDGPFGVMVHYHGGGWVGGSIASDDLRCHRTSCRAKVVIVSVEYRLAPEHKYPAGLEDSYAALLWVREHAASFSADPARIAVGGTSAGGNLAAACAMLARDRGGPAVRLQVLTYPICDTALTQPSHHENADAPLLTSRMMAWFIQQYLPPGADPADPLAAPLRSPDLHGLPPALVITADCDPLRDEGKDYAQRLLAAGVEASAVRYDGMVHGFITRAPDLPQSQAAMARIVSFLADRL